MTFHVIFNVRFYPQMANFYVKNYYLRKIHYYTILKSVHKKVPRQLQNLICGCSQVLISASIDFHADTLITPRILEHAKK